MLNVDFCLRGSLPTLATQTFLVNRWVCVGQFFKNVFHYSLFFMKCMWYAMYLFSVAASGQGLNWSIIGAFLLTLVMQGSVNLTEDISSAKVFASS